MGENKKVYLDYASSAPMRPLAAEMFSEYAAEYYQGSNPYAVHECGKLERKLLEKARKQIAACLDVQPSEVYFTSGGTEGDNLCLQGLTRAVRKAHPHKNKVLISAIEHSAIRGEKPYLESEGFIVEEVPVDTEGYLDLDALKDMLDESVGVVSVMAVNNEIGTIQPIDEIGRLAHEVGAVYHSDMVQSFMRCKVSTEHIDAATIAGHKIGAPHGTGAIYIKRGIPYENVIHGGIQEGGIRPGTPNAIGSAILGEVSERLNKTLDERISEMKRKALLLVNYLTDHSSDIKTTLTDFEHEPHVWEIIGLCVPGIDKQMIVLALDELGFEISSGSPCAPNADTANRILLAMGRPREEAISCVRVSYDERVSDGDILAFAKTFVEAVVTLKAKGHL